MSAMPSPRGASCCGPGADPAPCPPGALVSSPISCEYLDGPTWWMLKGGVSGRAGHLLSPWGLGKVTPLCGVATGHRGAELVSQGLPLWPVLSSWGGGHSAQASGPGRGSRKAGGVQAVTSPPAPASRPDVWAPGDRPSIFMTSARALFSMCPTGAPLMSPRLPGVPWHCTPAERVSRLSWGLDSAGTPGDGAGL